jgi:hypothetical protein
MDTAIGVPSEVEDPVTWGGQNIVQSWFLRGSRETKDKAPASRTLLLFLSIVEEKEKY